MIQSTPAKGDWLAHKPYSSHPDDAFLSIVIRAREPLGYGEGFVVHSYNSQQGGYSNGDYCSTWEEAIQAFNRRGSNR